MTYGYARCSTSESRQDIDRQVRALKQHGAEAVYLEYEHGDAAIKRQLEALLQAAQPGDTLLTLEVSRLTRSTQQLCALIERIRAGQLRLSIPGSILLDCRTGAVDPMTKAFVQMAGIFAEVELEMTRARIRSGLQNAAAKGKRLGRPPLTRDRIPAAFYRHYPTYRMGRLNLSELARVCGLSRPTVYKYIRIVEGGGEDGEDGLRRLKG